MDSEHSEPKPLANRIGNKTRIFYTSILFLGYLSLGLAISLFNPALVDLAYLFQKNKSDDTPTNQTDDQFRIGSTDQDDDKPDLSEISLIFTFFCLGFIIACLLTGLYKTRLAKRYLNRQLITSIFMILSALVECIVPQIRSIYLFFLANFFIGFGFGAVGPVCTTWLMELWSGKYLASILQALQLMYGLGAILSPILIKPFAHGLNEPRNSSSPSPSPPPVDLETRRKDISIPFAIAGGYQLAVGIFLLASFFFWRYRQPDYYDDDDDGGDGKGGKGGDDTKKLLDIEPNKNKRLLFHFLMTSLLMTYNMSETQFLNFQNTYYQELGINFKTAADLTTICATAYTLGRGANVIITRFLSATILIFGHLILDMIGFIALYLLQNIVEDRPLFLLMVNCAIIGYASSVMTPILYSFADNYARLDDRHTAVYTTTIGLPMLILPSIIGRYMHSCPNIIIYLALGALFAAMIIYICIRILISKAKSS